MAGIFISYRRHDTQSAAGRLADSLEEIFPDALVFRDVEALEAGVDFVDAITSALQSCSVMLAVIGPRFLEQSADGRRRIDDPNDYTRLELRTALSKPGVRVIPVLVEGATLPATDVLPDDLKPLVRRQAVELTDARWSYDVSQLASVLRRHVAADLPARSNSRLRNAAGAFAVVAIAGLLGYFGYGWLKRVPSAASVPSSSASMTSSPASAPDHAKQASSAPATQSASSAGPSPVPAPHEGSDQPCPKVMYGELPMPFACTCTGESTDTGTVWGTDVYTTDSALCRAALHAGAISSQGGTITVERVRGRPYYVGSIRNGVSTAETGAFSPAIRFAGAPPSAQPSPDWCPSNLAINRALQTPFNCTCTPTAVRRGVVWGTDVYTEDSSLCRAAVHAGVVSFEGGPISVIREPGRQLYSASTRHGVTSSDYGATEYSIHFAPPQR